MANDPHETQVDNNIEDKNEIGTKQLGPMSFPMPFNGILDGFRMPTEIFRFGREVQVFAGMNTWWNSNLAETFARGVWNQNALANMFSGSSTLMRLQDSIFNTSSLIDAFRTQLAYGVPQIVEAIQASSAISKLIGPSYQHPFYFNTDLVEQIQEVVSGLDRITKGMTASFTFSDLVSRALEQFDAFEKLRAALADDEAAAEAFRASGWHISPSMPKALIRRVVSLHKRGKTRYVSQTIMGYYRRNNFEHLAEAVEEWRADPLFGPRMRIIDDSLLAHRERKYTLTIPTLLPQVEGILNEYVVSNELPARLGSIKEVYVAVIGDPLEHDLSTWAIADTLLHQLSTNTYSATDFREELDRRVSKRSTTRHTVLHGINPAYHREIHSLRAFLLLDALSALQAPHPDD